MTGGEGREEAVDDLTGCTLDELLERLPSAERLADVAAHLDRLERIAAISPARMMPEGAANKVVVYAFMQSSINDAAFAALALRQLLPLIAALSTPSTVSNAREILAAEVFGVADEVHMRRFATLTTVTVENAIRAIESALKAGGGGGGG